MNPLITPREAFRLVLEALAPLPPERQPLGACINRVLREDLHADRDFPPFHRVMMDGIACRYEDLHSYPSLSSQQLHPAGAPDPGSLPSGHCYQVMTGAVLPDSCDTVVPYEEITLRGDSARPRDLSTIGRGQFIHQQGSDAQTDDLLLSAPARLSPACLALAASTGHAFPLVTRQARIHLFSTGDELVPIDSNPAPHQVRMSNIPALAAALTASNFTHHCSSHLADTTEAVSTAFSKALESSDVILCSGGISKGKRDFIRPVLEKLVGPPLFHGVSQRPGKPLAFWTTGKVHIFALPGNPNSTLACFYRYVLPALRQLEGLSDPPTMVTASALQRAPLPHPKLNQLLSATQGPDGSLELLVPQNSGDFLSTLSATHLVEVPAGKVGVTPEAYQVFAMA